jgi:thiosulfate reductase cytochrome b subunit
MKKAINYGFTLVLILVVAAGLYAARAWNSTTGLFPRAFGYPMLVLLVVIFLKDIVKDWRESVKQAKNVKNDVQDPSESACEEERREEEKAFAFTTKRMLLYIAWVIGFGAIIWAFGIAISIPVFVFAFMKVMGKYGWIKSLIFAALAGALIFVLFQFAFKVSWPDGAIITLIG